MTKRRIFVQSTAAAMFTAAARRSAWAANNYSLRLSIAAGQLTSQWDATVRFAKAVERRSNGRLKIELYPNGSLANQTESINGLTTGLVDITLQASVFFEQLFPRLQALDLPFLFKDAATTRRVVDGSIGDELLADMDAKGIRGLAWLQGGFRHLGMVSKPISSLADVKGLRIRVQNAPLPVGMVQAMGAIATPIDYSETYIALQQHTVDGLDAPLDAIASAKIDNVIKYVALTNHVYSLLAMVGSKQKIDALPVDLQHILKDEARGIIPSAWVADERVATDLTKSFKAEGWDPLESTCRHASLSIL